MRKIIAGIIFMFLLFHTLSAVEFDMKSNFSQGETLMARISGNFVEPLLAENIFFYRGHVQIPMEYDIAKIDNEYYLYALLGGKSPGEYSVALENVKYLVGTEISEENIAKNFTITNATADFSITPGFIITSEDFSIAVQNLQDYSINITVKENKTEEKEGGFFSFFFKGVEENEGESIVVKSGEIKNINFGLGNETSFRKVWLSTENLEYEIPVYAFVNSVPEEQEEEEEEQNASSDGQTGEENETQTGEEEEDNETTGKNCADINGTICKNNETCTGTSVRARDATCCKGTCKKTEEKTTLKIIGWSILVVVFIAIIWFFKKKSRAKKTINLKDIAKGKKIIIK